MFYLFGKGGKTLELTATITPSTYSGTISWSLENTTYGTLSSTTGKTNTFTSHSSKCGSVTLNVSASNKSVSTTITVKEWDALVPKMTSNGPTNGFVISCSSDAGGYTRYAWKAFNQDLTKSDYNVWEPQFGAATTNTWIQVKSSTQDKIYKARVGLFGEIKREECSWYTYVRASNDGTNWKQISDRVTITYNTQDISYYDYICYDDTPYCYYQIYLDGSPTGTTLSHKANYYACCFIFLQFYGIKGS